MNIFKDNHGVAILPAVIVIGIMALAVVISITSVSFNELLISQGQAQSSNALFYAESGARDALIKIARNKNYTCSVVDCYSLDFIINGCINGSNCSKISVSPGLGTISDPKIIISKGIMKSSIRIIHVNVILDNGSTSDSNQNGQITSTTWTELTD